MQFGGSLHLIPYGTPFSRLIAEEWCRSAPKYLIVEPAVDSHGLNQTLCGLTNDAQPGVHKAALANCVLKNVFTHVAPLKQKIAQRQPFFTVTQYDLGHIGEPTSLVSTP